jgi:hypothetical protein
MRNFLSDFNYILSLGTDLGFFSTYGYQGQTQRQTMQENSRLPGINSSKLMASRYDGCNNGSLQMNGVHKVLHLLIPNTY